MSEINSENERKPAGSTGGYEERQGNAEQNDCGQAGGGRNAGLQNADGRNAGGHNGGRRGNKMENMPVPQLVITMAIPMMFSLLIQSLYNIVDSMYVARYSVKALTATSLAYPVQILMIALSVGTSVGINALISRLLGMKAKEEVRQAASTGLVLSFASTFVFMIVGIFFAKPIAYAMTDDAEIADMCASYLGICLTFCIGMFLQTMVQRFLQANGNAAGSMISLVSGAIVNIILDPIMIFGLLGCPAMGIKGAAIATVIGQCIGAAVAVFLNVFFNPDVQPIVKGYHFEWKTVAAIYKVGLPTIIMQAMGSIMNFGMNRMLLSVSENAVAFFGVYYKLQNFLCMPMNGLGQASIPIVGYNFGAKRGDRIMKTLKTSLPVGIGIGLAATVLFELFPGQLLSLFSANEEMLAIGIPAMRIISVTFALTAATIILGYSANGLGNGMVNMLANALRQVILLLPLSFVLLKNGGISVMWYAMIVSETLAVVYAVIRVRQELERKVKPLL